jgi:farnesyl diphosphate synthase
VSIIKDNVKKQKMFFFFKLDKPPRFFVRDKSSTKNHPSNGGELWEQTMSLKTELVRIAADVDRVLNEMIPAQRWESAPANVARYVALDAGKRIRSFLTVQSAALFDVDYDSSIRAGACVEMVHNFSLIHDDLPCIDNDRLRRGKPSAWAKFGECDAILGGDYLLSHAFFILATDEKISRSAATRLELIRILSEMTSGMIFGEWMDVQAEDGKFKTAPEVNSIQSLKTGCIFNACTMFGAALGGADDLARAALRKFTDAMGLCFQITDDILDAIGDEEKVGKTLRKDDAAGKATYITLYGLDGARGHAARIAAEAKGALDMFGARADNLRELMDYMITRES